MEVIKITTTNNMIDEIAQKKILVKSNITPLAYDHDLIKIFKPLAFEEYEYLTYDKTDTTNKDVFLRDTTKNPHLTYSNAKNLDKTELAKKLLSLQEKLNSGDYHPAVIRAYTARLNEARMSLELLSYAEKERDEDVYRLSCKIYGEPDLKMFRYTLQEIKREVEIAKNVTNDPVSLKILSCLEPLFEHIIPEELFEWANIALPNFEDNFSTETLSADEIYDMFSKRFKELEISDWEIIKDEKNSRITFNTNQSNKEIHIPGSEALLSRKHSMTFKHVKALVEHEVGVHVQRRNKGDKSSLALLGLGLNGYLRGEEGIATYVEQNIEGTDEFAGAIGYLAVAIAVGLDGIPRSFKESFDIIRAYRLARIISRAQRKGTIINEESFIATAINSANSQAWARCIRTYRGTTGNTPGMALTRDIVYREGNIGIWQCLEKDSKMKDNFFLGKFDPTSQFHLDIIKELGILNKQ